MVGHRHQGVYAKSAFPLVLSLTAASYFMLLLDAKLHRPIKSGNLGKIRSETSHFFLRKNYKRKDSFRKCICGKFAISSVINFKNIKIGNKIFLVRPTEFAVRFMVRITNANEINSDSLDTSNR